MKSKNDFSKGKKSAVVKVPKGKSKIRLTLDDDVIDWFRVVVEEQSGGSYQTLINDALKEYIKSEEEQIKQILTHLRIEKKKCKLRDQLKQWHKDSEKPRNIFIGERKK